MMMMPQPWRHVLHVLDNDTTRWVKMSGRPESYAHSVPVPLYAGCNGLSTFTRTVLKRWEVAWACDGGLMKVHMYTSHADAAVFRTWFAWFSEQNPWTVMAMFLLQGYKPWL